MRSQFDAAEKCLTFAIRFAILDFAFVDISIAKDDLSLVVLSLQHQSASFVVELVSEIFS